MKTVNDPKILLLKKYVWSMMLKNKVKDVKNIYQFAYANGLNDEEISKVFNELNF
jgi:hypothetical protein